MLGRDQGQEPVSFQSTTSTSSATSKATDTSSAPATDGDISVVEVPVEGGENSAASSTPRYVHELYRRFRERIALEELEETARKARQDKGDVWDVSVEGEERGGEVLGGVTSSSRAFVDSVVGQLKVQYLIRVGVRGGTLAPREVEGFDFFLKRRCKRGL